MKNRLPSLPFSRLFAGRQWPAFLILFLLMTPFLAGRSTADPLQDPNGQLPDGPFVVRVYYEEISDIDDLAGYDLWEYNNLEEKYVLIGANRYIYENLQAAGWTVVVDYEVTEREFTSSKIAEYFGGYRSVSELYADMIAIRNANPTLTEIVNYGDSYCAMTGGCLTPGNDFNVGFPLLAMRVTNQEIPGPKPVFFLMAALHSREITTPELAMRLLDWLIDGYGQDPDATWIVDHHEVWIVPVANPDGLWLVELGTQPPYNGNPFTQRKNANPTGCATQWPPQGWSQYGVDLNRNHSFQWGGAGGSTAPCNLTYRGTEAASEVEVYQLENLVTSLYPNPHAPVPGDPAPDDTMGIFISLHSYSELILWPWGYANIQAPNYLGLKAIGDKMATYNGYLSCQAPQCLYAASGISDDWSYGTLGIPSFTFEVGTQFMPPYSEIDAVQWPDNGPAMIYAAKIARTPYMTVHGPDALDVVAVTDDQNNVTVTATINDSQNGNNPIAEAVFYVNNPYWATGAITHTMEAVDGNFNSPVEDVIAYFDADDLVAGQHILFVRGKDNQGNWGPVSAAFFDVEQDGQMVLPEESVAVALYPGETSEESFVIQNAGLGKLTWSLPDAAPADWLAAAPDNGVIAPGEAVSVTLTFAPDLAVAPGLYTATLEIASDDPENPSGQAAVEMLVLTPDGMTLQKTASADTVVVNEPFTYTLSSQLSLTGTHAYTQTLWDILPEGVSVLTETIALNGSPAPWLYDPHNHLITATLAGDFTDSLTTMIVFQVQAGLAAEGETLTNALYGEAVVNGEQWVSVLPAQIEVLVLRLRRHYLPVILSE